MLGLSADEVLGKKVDLIRWGALDISIIGVAENYNFSSLKDQIEPLIILNGPRYRRFAIKINAANIGEAMTKIGEMLTNIYFYPLDH